jgi:hypothetical protein
LQELVDALPNWSILELPTFRRRGAVIGWQSFGGDDGPMKMKKDQKERYMQAVHYRSLSDRLLRAATTVFLGAIFLWLIGIGPMYFAFLLVIGIGVAGAAFFLQEKYWKCPGCNAKLPTKQGPWDLERCPKCGLTLSGQEQTEQE